VTLHPSADTLLAHPQAPDQQRLPHSWPNVFAFDFGMECPDVYFPRTCPPFFLLILYAPVP
jgi:hypothetical protein